MSLESKVDSNWDSLSVKKQVLAEALSWSATGRNLIVAAHEFSQSEAAQDIKAAIMDKTANPIDRFKMAQYLAMALECSPRENLLRFTEYLTEIAEKATSYRRKNYYLNLKAAVERLSRSNELAIYMAIYSAFLQDESESSTLARDVMSQITRSMQKIMGEYC